MAPIPSFTDAAKAIAKDFEYSDDDVRKSVKHFLAQMRTFNFTFEQASIH